VGRLLNTCTSHWHPSLIVSVSVSVCLSVCFLFILCLFIWASCLIQEIHTCIMHHSDIVCTDDNRCNEYDQSAGRAGGSRQPVSVGIRSGGRQPAQLRLSACTCIIAFFSERAIQLMSRVMSLYYVLVTSSWQKPLKSYASDCPLDLSTAVNCVLPFKKNKFVAFTSYNNQLIDLYFRHMALKK